MKLRQRPEQRYLKQLELYREQRNEQEGSRKEKKNIDNERKFKKLEGAGKHRFDTWPCRRQCAALRVGESAVLGPRQQLHLGQARSSDRDKRGCTREEHVLGVGVARHRIHGCEALPLKCPPDHSVLFLYGTTAGMLVARGFGSPITTWRTDARRQCGKKCQRRGRHVTRSTAAPRSAYSRRLSECNKEKDYNSSQSILDV